jgi:hypothetical protein
MAGFLACLRMHAGRGAGACGWPWSSLGPEAGGAMNGGHEARPYGDSERETGIKGYGKETVITVVSTKAFTASERSLRRPATCGGGLEEERGCREQPLARNR